MLRASAVTALALAALATPTPAAAELSPKIDPALVHAMADAADGKVEMLVVLADQADLSAAREIHGKEAKGRFVYETLSAHAARTQEPLLAELRHDRVPHRSYWVANFVAIAGDRAMAERLAARADVASLVANPPMAKVPPIDDGGISWPEGSMPLTPLGIEWNIVKVNADEVWSLGYTGQGAVVGGQDTGYDWDHPALQDMYRGWNGASASHDYNWHDAIHTDILPTGGNSCGYDVPAPCDDDSHGTHTMGTMVGDDGGVNQIGMAPGAKWIGCRNMDDGYGNPTTYSECFEWFIAPTTVAGGSPDPGMAPHVINNSWGCPLSGYPSGWECIGQAANVMQQVVENVRAAGIVVVVSAGNEGSACGTVAAPAAIYDASFSVGSTTSTDAMSGFSSRGPVTVDGSNRMKPDISAPGSNVRSCIPGTGYASFSGTSMAGPHVAGLVALLISAKPELAGEVDTIEQIIRDSAFQPANPAAQTCGGTPSNVFPNNIFGAGRIDALAAVQLALTGMPFLADFEENDLDEWSAAAP